MDLNAIDIIPLIRRRISENDISMQRICNFFNLEAGDMDEMLSGSSLDTEMVLKWSKLLEYDFFRLYSQQLLLRSQKERRYSHIVSSLPVFRKKIYTKETIDFIIKQVQTGAKTAKQLSEEYDIPKPTIYRWLNKCSKEIKSKKAPAAKSISGGKQ